MKKERKGKAKEITGKVLKVLQQIKIYHVNRINERVVEFLNAKKCANCTEICFYSIPGSVRGRIIIERVAVSAEGE